MSLFRSSTNHSKKTYGWVPFLAAACLLCLALLFSRYLLEREHSHVRTITAAALNHVQSEIASEVEGRIQALERISERWALGGMPTKNSWDEEARLYIRHYPGIQSVSWVDPSFQTRWAVPFEHNQYLLEAETSAALRQMLESARERKKPVIADAMELPRGGRGFAIYTPITLVRSGEFHGFTGGIFRGEKLFELILANVATDYSIALFDSAGGQLFIRGRDNVAPDRITRRWQLDTSIDIRGIRWQVRVWPSQSVLKTQLSALPGLVLAGGVLFAGLLGGIIYLLQQTRRRAYRIARINLALKRQMKRRQHAETALRETSARLHLALRSSGMGTWRLDLVRNTMAWDEALSGLLGLSAETLGGGFEDFLHCMHPADHEPIRTSIVHAIDSSSEYHARYRVLLPDTSERYLESRGSVHYDDSGKPSYLTGVTWDVTEQKKAEEAERYTEVLKRSNEELERFAYVASHDLKSPLANIVHYTEELLNNAPSKDPPQVRIERMHQAAVRMSALIDGLLEYSRAETETQKMESVDLTTVFKEIVIDLESHIRQHGGSVEIAAQLPAVTGDRLQLRQLFQNLIANGIKFHPPGIAPKVTVTGGVVPGTASKVPGTPQPGDTVEICVQDNGIGIEKEYLETIFKPFNRLHRRDEYEGSGIGLATCQRIIARHGGTIEVKSELGKGSSFLIRLPCTPQVARVSTEFAV